MRPANPNCASADRRAGPWSIVAWTWLLALALVAPAWATVGNVSHLSGVLSVQKPSGERRILSVQSAVDEGDLLITEDKTFARIKFKDGGNLVLRPNSRVRIDRYSYQPDRPEADNVAMDLVKGGLRSITGAVARRNPERHTTTTANATIGIRGTHFGVQHCQGDCAGQTTLAGKPLPDGVHIDVHDGRIVVSNPAGRIEVAAGQFAYVGAPNQAPVNVPSEDGSRVAVPPSMVSETGGGMTVGRDSNDDKCVVK